MEHVAIQTGGGSGGSDCSEKYDEVGDGNGGNHDFDDMREDKGTMLNT